MGYQLRYSPRLGWLCHMLLHGFDPIEHTVTGWCSKGDPWIDVAMALHFQHCHSLSNHVWSVDDFRLLHLLGNVFAALCNWTWMSLNIYCIWVVKSHLKNVQMKQSPDIEYYNDV